MLCLYRTSMALPIFFHFLVVEKNKHFVSRATDTEKRRDLIAILGFLKPDTVVKYEFFINILS